MKPIFTLFFSAIVLLSVSSANTALAQSRVDAPTVRSSVDDIVKKANIAAYYAGNDGRSDVKLTITDSQGRERTRAFTILRLDVEDGKDQKFYVYFEKPEDVRDMVYMVWKHLGRDDDRWLYLPALDLVRRIAASDKRSSFVGSDFVYEDVSGRSITEDTHELIEETGKYYKLKNVPKDSSGVEFSYYDIWINKSNFIPYMAEYYDKNNTLYKKVEALEIRDIDSFPTVVKSKVSNIASGGATVAEFTNISYNTGMTDDIFTERYLRRPPRRWLR